MEEEDPATRLSKMTGLPPPNPPRSNVGPLEYRPADSNEPYEFVLRWYQQPGVGFSAGLFGGTALSAFIWLVGWDHFMVRDLGLWVMIAVLCVKSIGGTFCLTIRRCRPFGAGLLSSLASGCMIFGFGALSQCGKPF